MSPDEALAWWFGRIDYERRQPRPGDLKLDRMHALLAALGRPDRPQRFLHVAGSKGKGSVSALLAAILQAAGYRTGLFTSPHLETVHERIRVDGQCVSAEELAVLIADVKAAAETRSLAPTFFEVGTAAGLLHFARRRCDWSVIEVGLGGRYDSTNVITPRLAIITSISLDHTHLLGDRHSLIAREKAGIVKRGRPTISGATHAEAAAVIAAVCAEQASSLDQLDRDFHVTVETARLGPEASAAQCHGPWVQVTTRQRQWPSMRLGLLGRHQAANAAVVIAAVERLRQEGAVISDAAVAAGLANVYWPARMELVAVRPWVVLDCAHNVASIEALIATLHESLPRIGRRWLIFGVSADKDVPGMLHELARVFDEALFTRTDSPRAVQPERLADLWQSLTAKPCHTFAQPQQAWQAVRRQAGPEDGIVITGSVFLAGALHSTVRIPGEPTA